MFSILFRQCNVCEWVPSGLAAHNHCHNHFIPRRSLSLSLVGSQEVAASVTQLQLCGEKGEERKALSVMETRQY